MPYTPILGSLGYVLSPDGGKVLLVHRNARDDDQHLGKYNGLGGKMEPGEDIYQCLTREIREEAGIRCLDAVLRGTINWTGFGPNGEDWLGFIFLVMAVGMACGTRFYGTAVVRQFEMMGVFSLNESVAITRARDKLRSLQLLARRAMQVYGLLDA